MTLFLWACVPVEEEIAYTFEVDLQDPRFRRIYTLQDKLAVDSLLPYLSSEHPVERYFAAMAFGSIRDTHHIEHLVPLLDDQYQEVRIAAAFALGQGGSEKAGQYLVAAFRQYDSLSVNTGSNSMILESVGKCGKADHLEALATVRTYTPDDTLLLLGQMRGIYRFALRGMAVREGTATAIKYLTGDQFPQPVRLMAAHYLFRATDLDYDPYVNRLINTFENDPDPEIRMCMAVALGKARREEGLNSLLRRFPLEPDYRVQYNILRGLAFFEYDKVRDLFFSALDHQNPHVRRSAAQYFVDYGDPLDGQMYRSVSRSLDDPWLQARMYEATNKYLADGYTITKSNLVNELESAFEKTDDPYLQAAFLKAISGDVRNFDRIYALGGEAENPVVRTAALDALSKISTRPALEKKFRGNRLRRVRGTLFGYFLEALQSGDIAAIAIAAQTFSNPKAGMEDLAREHIGELKSILSGIPRPKAIESYYALSACIASLEGRVFDPEPAAYNHPMDWSLFQGGSAEMQAEIITSKGIIQVALYARDAPGTVANFIELARSGFYAGKAIHRVVPNFVVQGGCPRGDGYGSLDYSIRSELKPVYYDDTGYLGMASAGPHTECTQWFITHSPTPHLDGRYTIFGKVTEGMDIVHQIEVGDRIQEIHLLH